MELFFTFEQKIIYKYRFRSGQLDAEGTVPRLRYRDHAQEPCQTHQAQVYSLSINQSINQSTEQKPSWLNQTYKKRMA